MPETSEPLPSMQMYETWRERRVQRFSSGVERMRTRLKDLQAVGEVEPLAEPEVASSVSLAFH